MHQRPEISELFCISAKRFVEYWEGKYDITICALISDQESEAICNRYQINVIPTPVSPLGTKFNAGMEIIMRKFSFDYLLQISDDDIFSPELLTWYEAAILGRVPYFGLKELYFLDSTNDRAIHFKYRYETNKLVGCGRMFLREAILKTAYKCDVVGLKNRTFNGVILEKNKQLFIPEYQAKYLHAMGFVHKTTGAVFALWKNEQIRGMDSESETNMVLNNYMPIVIPTDRPLITDVKSDKNIWKFEDFEKFGDVVEASDAMHFWSDEEREYYVKLKSKKND